MGDVAVVAGGDILQEKMEKEINHVLVVPFPLQGHINPLVQFSKRLVSKGLKVTLAVTKYTAKSMQDRPPATSSSISVEPISDGIQEGEIIPDEETYLDRIKVNVSKTLTDLIIRLNQSSCPPKFLIYDSIMPWALDVGQKLGLRGASFFTQAYSVNAIYYHFRRGEIKVPANSENVTVPPLPTLSVNDLPSFICDPNSDPALVDLLLSQFSNFQEADWVLNNSFDQLESEVVNWMSSQWRIKNIGPTVPSMFLDKRLEDDKDYGLSLFKPDADTCLTWLDSKQPGSVVYVSFGSLASLEGEQMIELARGLQMSGSHFLWVVRDLEWKLPASFIEETSDKGLVVSWSPQLEVLAHKSVGCFMTHCGWNSTLEALSLGVPMVAMPQWTDQPTNAKFVADVWKVGIRVKVNEGGMVSREEISECIKEIMEGEKGTEIRKNSEKWRDLARNAVDEGGSSDKNIDEFIAFVASN
ncbi:UDP-glycosyltransferase 74E2-like [Carica papaya]|uniref:UDP-glycosyltransferase 74E2-like n=1 Tax=Carica papaya TaxID=3649 RepID=UPI000B8CFCC0|nr:UDP-glycosyltransferase 74E2-like [Carica papaya]